MDYVLSENPKCVKNIVLSPNDVPDRVKHKTVGIVINNDIRKFVLPDFFNCKDVVDVDDKTVLLLTQPFRKKDISKFSRINMYESIANRLYELGYKVVLKPHPRDKLGDYVNVKCEMILESYIPVEVMLMGGDSKPVLLSIASSSGMGFENYCKPLRIIEHNFFEKIKEFASNPDSLIAELDILISSNFNN